MDYSHHTHQSNDCTRFSHTNLLPSLLFCFSPATHPNCITLLQVYNFPLMQTGTTGSFDNYQKILDCVKGNGFSGCYSLAEQWTSVVL